MSSDHSCSTTKISDGAAFSTVHPDIIDTHILTRLDGPTLASARCVSTQFQFLCINENLWRNICNATWPSIKDPRVRDAVSTFPSGYRSFFSNSFSSLHHPKIRRGRDQDRLPSALISAVDIHYKGQPVYSKVKVTNALAEGFLYWPTWVDLMNPREKVATTIKFGIAEDELMSHVTEHVTLSWIVIDPTHKLAANLSSLWPVLVEPHWLNGHVHMHYSTLLTTGDPSVLLEAVEFRITLTCKVKEGGEMNVKELNLEALDMNGKSLTWKDSLVILQKAMEGGRRGNWKRGKEKERYKEYLKLQGDGRMKGEEGKEMGALVLKIVGFGCMVFMCAAFFLWVFWCFLNRYILRRTQR